MILTVTEPFQKYLESIGADLPGLLQKAEIPNKLWKEEVSLTNLEYYRLLLEFDKVMSEQAIRTLSDISQFQMFVPAFFAALSSQNGIEALGRFARFKKIVGPIEVDVTESDNTVSVHYSYALRQMELPKFSVLNEQLLVLNLMRAGVGEHIRPLLVESPFAYEEDTEREFGIAVQQSEYNQIVFDKKDMERAFLTRNNVMWQFLEPGLESQLAKMDSDRTFAGYVQQELFSAIPAGAFQTEDIAKRLGVSVRTLQRNLTAEGTTFQQQVQAVQKAMAFSYLKMNLTTDEIASLLGYNEVNSFVRAFGKWTGTTITEYRRDTK